MRSTWRDRDRDFRRPLTDGETTSSYLRDVLYSTNSDYDYCMNPGNERYIAAQGISCDEVYPGIFIGNASAAKNIWYLEKLGITHVLNAAEGKECYKYVNTGRNFYKDTPIKYMGLHLEDSPGVNISQYFYPAASFIAEGLANGGRVFVHCMVGVSRSATCVLAYLMIRKGMLAAEAIRVVRRRREINPNVGFLKQIAELDNSLRRERLR